MIIQKNNLYLLLELLAELSALIVLDALSRSKSCCLKLPLPPEISPIQLIRFSMRQTVSGYCQAYMYTIIKDLLHLQGEDMRTSLSN